MSTLPDFYFEEDIDMENSEYYEYPNYFISKALYNWDNIIDNVNKLADDQRPDSKWFNIYKSYLGSMLQNVDSFVIYNGLQTFHQIVSICNSYHQTRLLRDYLFACPIVETEENYNPYTDDSETITKWHYWVYNNTLCEKYHQVKLLDWTREQYDYIGFIEESTPKGHLVLCKDE
jgi:hypothetical protein